MPNEELGSYSDELINVRGASDIMSCSGAGLAPRLVTFWAKRLEPSVHNWSHVRLGPNPQNLFRPRVRTKRGSTGASGLEKRHWVTWNFVCSSRDDG